MEALNGEVSKLPAQQREIAISLITAAVDISADMKDAMPLFKLIVILTSLLSFGCIGGGVYAISKSATSNTHISFLGADLSTGSVGVALVGIGLIIGFFTVKEVLKKL